jgi:hypothetical protein
MTPTKKELLFYEGCGSGLAEPPNDDNMPNVKFIEKKPKPPNYTTLSS